MLFDSILMPLWCRLWTFTLIHTLWICRRLYLLGKSFRLADVCDWDVVRAFKVNILIYIKNKYIFTISDKVTSNRHQHQSYWPHTSTKNARGIVMQTKLSWTATRVDKLFMQAKLSQAGKRVDNRRHQWSKK